MITVKLPKVIRFEWDKGNEQKNWLKHQVSIKEAEEAISAAKKMLFEDIKHSTLQEKRFILFCKTPKQRMLVIAFTMRSEKVRIISARSMNRREAIIYEEAISAA